MPVRQPDFFGDMTIIVEVELTEQLIDPLVGLPNVKRLVIQHQVHQLQLPSHDCVVLTDINVNESIFGTSNTAFVFALLHSLKIRNMAVLPASTTDTIHNRCCSPLKNTHPTLKHFYLMGKKCVICIVYFEPVGVWTDMILIGTKIPTYGRR